MEPEKERLRPRVPKKRPSEEESETMPPEFRKEPEDHIQFETIRKNYAQETSIVLGFSFVIVGLLGFVIPYFLNFHLSYTNNIIHVVTGTLALWFGFDRNITAKRFCYIAGAFYAVLGLLGFVAGTPGIASVANPVEDRFLWRFIPEVLEFGTTDHAIHLLVGITFLLAAIMKFTVKVPKEGY
ncbi:DUF4383 domain-containing protein [Bdellovibrio svalbardensis]|uniref:DUF4383 domain-containing protein n=1 Tax=Bdellovibrio svalbardensis TaxID=2972972 RepID=A0ABT6DDI1_9BACT|nr:DUF4383 domain-containing protein [Bdellovibrio svalbardensis]MDG0814901.1 DUF4383 domain-containing protein [Bdellovibrio svalbardensis]